MKNLLYFAFILISLTAFAQEKRVGINTTTPQETLDVNGVLTTKKLYLRDPGSATQTGGGYLAATVSESKIGIYPTNEALFSYLPLTFTNVNKDGLIDYDTKIPADKYIVVLHNYAIKTKSGSTAVALKYPNVTTTTGYGSNQVTTYTNQDFKKQGSPNFTAYKAGTPPTWHVTGNFTNSELKDTNSSPQNRFTINMYLMVYRYIITKQNITQQNATFGAPAGITGASGIPAPDGF